ncbi:MULTISPECIES: KUP/HAK/KT family potassium transporter [Arenibacter]|uniref:KUP/HAK/KT family potassium transporter n=1 Tax=Arenibacter TaxID=178469 RepID=UPI0019655710
MIGCATLISDGYITPAISISSAVEGLYILYEGIPTLPIVCGIQIALFLIEQFRTKKNRDSFWPCNVGVVCNTWNPWTTHPR